MISEARIKELVEKFYKEEIGAGGINRPNIGANVLMRWFRTVAAESRKEGIEKAYRDGYEEAAGNLEYLENLIYEYLKEQGNV